MGYKLDIDRLKHPLLKTLLQDLLPNFEKLGLEFYIVGATARDILMELNGVQPSRRTRDIDFAIAIDHWDKFYLLEDEIVKNDSFKKDSNQKQRFIYRNDFEIDIIPFGAIAKQEDKIFWPPDQNIALTILGYDEASRNTITVDLGEVKVKVANLQAIFLLKLFAWEDRNLTGNKDADDLGFVLQNYLSIHQDRAAAEFYNEVYEMPSFTEVKGGAVLLGTDVSKLIGQNKKTKTELKKIIQNELRKKEESRLFNQIIETNRIRFDEIFEAFSLFNQYLD